MEYVSEGAIEGRNMRRISTHPKAGVQDVFIDMGIYEYQYVQLVTGGDEIDVIWVAETEAQGEKCDGSTWEKATSDLQNAIETLLLSLNNHDKVIKMRGGTYRPLKMTGGNQKTFFIATPSKNDGVMTPAGLTVGDQTLVARSLTIYGGYTNEPLADYDDGELTRDPVANPVVFKMTREEGNTDRQLAHLFIIEDAEVKGNYVNYLTNRNKDFKDYTMPIVFDGLTFENPYGLSGTSEGDFGGADIFYRTQYMTEQMGETFTKNEGKLLKAALDGGGNAVPKIIIRNCVFANSGSDEHCSAVKIQEGDGPALIANSLFHSNHGAPVEAVNTQVVNCTFALNGGHATITNLTENYADGSSANYPSGILETWRITNAHYADNITTTTGTEAYADNYDGHRYPHAGSVVYLDEGASLVVSLGAEDEPLFTAGNPLQPGYVLLKDGASLYGQGNTLQLPYVAAEKNATASLQYLLAALPFLQWPQDVFTTIYNSSSDALAETPLAHTAYTYNGYKRSRYHIDQDFRIRSPCAVCLRTKA